MARWLVSFFLLCSAALAQTETTRLWAAKWIDVPGASQQGYGVYHFRKAFQLTKAPSSLNVHVSGDNRYQLYVNGKRVSWGPARSDLTHWAYETVDIARELRPGMNVLAAVVWNDGPYRAIAQISNQTGFVLQAEDAVNNFINTDRSWKCIQDQAYSAQLLPAEQRTGYYALGPNEKFDAGLYPWNWEQVDFNDSSWSSAHEITPAASRDARDAPNRWMLVASSIPLEEQAPEKPMELRRADAAATTGAQIHVPPNATAKVLFDLGHLTTAYPEVSLQQGKGARIDMRYAETLYVRKSGPADKGNRSEVEGKTLYGPADTYLADGQAHTYKPLFWRTYRYIQLEITTASQEVTVAKPTGTFTAYPFEQKAKLGTSAISTTNCSVFSLRAGERRAYALTKPIWIARSMNSCSMAAMRVSR